MPPSSFGTPGTKECHDALATELDAMLTLVHNAPQPAPLEAALRRMQSVLHDGLLWRTLHLDARRPRKGGHSRDTRVAAGEPYGVCAGRWEGVTGAL